MSSDPTAGLQVEGLARRFGRRWAVAGVSLEVPRGEALLVTGPNGSGKTTLLRCVATALKPHQGSARFGGRDLWAERRSLRRAIAFVSHASRLYEDLSAAQNLSAWAAMGGYRADGPALLDAVGLPRRSEPARSFSAGMKKRLSLALALLKRPALVLLDEPFSALDPEGRAQVQGVLAQMRADGATLVLATHLVDAGAACCQRALHMEQGQVLWRGPAAEAPQRVTA